MKVTREQLNNFGLLESLPQELKTLSDQDYFVFYYATLEQESKLYVYTYQVEREVNISLYRILGNLNSSQSKALHKPLNIGFFSNTFETRDGIFYLFLRTYNDLDKVTDFYKYAVEQDRIVDLNVSTNAIPDIGTSDDFRRAISYFCNGRLQTIMQLYDMVNQAMIYRLSKPLYGNSIKKVVNLILYDGGVLPEMNGKLRFMVVGEKANLTNEQAEALREAKNMLRSMIPIDKIYSLTGWALSTNDGRWRTNIDDSMASILTTSLYDYQDRKLYVPSGQTIADVLPVIQKPERAISNAYSGRLIEVLSHPTLYRYYPNLAIMPIVFIHGGRNINGRYYFSPDERGGYIYMNGTQRDGDPLSILLHEIQHSIQRTEGFATGGNLFLARFVASVGSNAVRKIFACINKMERYFREYLFNFREELLLVVSTDIPDNQEGEELKKDIVAILSNQEEFTYKYKVVSFYLVLYIAHKRDFSTNEIVEFIETKMPNKEVLYELFENINEGYAESLYYRQKLMAEGYREEDIKDILFKGYENLYGEMESRSVQISRFVESEFRNYFYLTKWENTPIQQFTVIDGVEDYIELKDIKAAIETKNEEYVLHFKRQITSEPFIHELAHIVHDCLNKLQLGEKIREEYDKDLFSNNIDEWFVSQFLAYVKGKIQDENLQKDLFKILYNPKPEISKMLDMFFMNPEIDKRLKYLQTILDL